ncbi:MAG: NUDIX hydrolase [Alphaproteobacteria bacterium]|nr:NUDIX hydrolase [Alphaproteobacteria bacterium]
MSMEQSYYLGIKGIVKNASGLILLLKHKKGYWDLPGGRVSRGETPEQTLLREVEEETGLTGLRDIKAQSMVLSPIMIKNSDQQSHGLIFWYHTCTQRQDVPIKLSDEHTEYRWATSDDIIATLSLPEELIKGA